MYCILYTSPALSMTLLKFESEQEAGSAKAAKASASRLKVQGCTVHFVGTEKELLIRLAPGKKKNGSTRTS